MFENLPQLSQAVRDTIGRELSVYDKLGKAERASRAEARLKQLKEANHWIGSAIEGTIYPFEDVQQELKSAACCPGETNESLVATLSEARTFVLETILILLEMLDQALWAKSMEGKIRGVIE